MIMIMIIIKNNKRERVHRDVTEIHNYNWEMEEKSAKTTMIKGSFARK